MNQLNENFEHKLVKMKHVFGTAGKPNSVQMML